MSDISAIFGSDHWYKGIVASGVALALPAISFHERDFALFAVGMVLFGLGEWINHPHRIDIYPEAGAELHKRSRLNSPVGLGLAVLGGLIQLLELFRLLF